MLSASASDFQSPVPVHSPSVPPVNHSGAGVPPPPERLVALPFCILGAFLWLNLPFVFHLPSSSHFCFLLSVFSFCLSPVLRLVPLTPPRFTQRFCTARRPHRGRLAAACPRSHPSRPRPPPLPPPRIRLPSGAGVLACESGAARPACLPLGWRCAGRRHRASGIRHRSPCCRPRIRGEFTFRNLCSAFRPLIPSRVLPQECRPQRPPLPRPCPSPHHPPNRRHQGRRPQRRPSRRPHLFPHRPALHGRH